MDMLLLSGKKKILFVFQVYGPFFSLSDLAIDGHGKTERVCPCIRTWYVVEQKKSDVSAISAKNGEKKQEYFVSPLTRPLCDLSVFFFKYIGHYLPKTVCIQQGIT